MSSDILMDSPAGAEADHRRDEELTESADLITRWQADARTQGLSESSIAAYGWAIKNFQKNCNGQSLLGIDKLQIRAYVEFCRKGGLTTTTISHRLAALSSFYDWAIFEGLSSINPVLEVRTRYIKSYKKNGNSEQHTHQLVSIQDAAKVIGITPDIRDKAILMVLFKTGIRRNELCSLEVSDINWKNQSITLKPTAKRTNRIVFFDDECASCLRRWLAVREYRNRKGLPALWISSRGALTGKGIGHMIQLVGLGMGLHNPNSDRMEDHFSAHCCRHWFTTHLLRAGMRREYVQWLRGDAIKEAVDIYFHVDPEDVRRSYLASVPQLGV